MGDNLRLCGDPECCAQCCVQAEADENIVSFDVNTACIDAGCNGEFPNDFSQCFDFDDLEQQDACLAGESFRDDQSSFFLFFLNNLIAVRLCCFVDDNGNGVFENGLCLTNAPTNSPTIPVLPTLSPTTSPIIVKEGNSIEDVQVAAFGAVLAVLVIALVITILRYNHVKKKNAEILEGKTQKVWIHEGRYF